MAGSNSLTPREHEVATLVARGLSNRQIAEHLVISERTAENHLSHILDKLGFTSRAQIATWVVQQRTGTPDASDRMSREQHLKHAESSERLSAVRVSAAPHHLRSDLSDSPGRERQVPTPELPIGTVTFLLTDIEGSTRLWDQHSDGMRAALVQHDALIDALVAEHGGTVVRPRGEGDSRFAVFAQASAAVAAAGAVQMALHQQPWPLPEPLRVRMALHTGEADLRDGDYYGNAVNRCARLRLLAHGGQVLVSGTTAAIVRNQWPTGFALRHRGTRRLKDFTEPEAIFQLVHPELPDEFPPLAPPGNLPIPPTALIGRGREVQELSDMLRASQRRLVTLVGPGGVGKTRLALAVGAALLDQFLDGVWLVELAPLGDPALIASTLATNLGVREQPGVPVRDSLIEALRPRSMLLLLDNCEHLIEGCAELVRDLLYACPGLRVVATSREPLRIPLEQSWPVPTLLGPDLRSLPAVEHLADLPAVRLFLDRAQAVSPSFELTAHNSRSVAGICAKVEGLPLALELAAAWVRVLAPGQILD